MIRDEATWSHPSSRPARTAVHQNASSGKGRCHLSPCNTSVPHFFYHENEATLAANVGAREAQGALPCFMGQVVWHIIIHKIQESFNTWTKSIKSPPCPRDVVLLYQQLFMPPDSAAISGVRSVTEKPGVSLNFHQKDPKHLTVDTAAALRTGAMSLVVCQDFAEDRPNSA